MSITSTIKTAVTKQTPEQKVEGYKAKIGGLVNRLAILAEGRAALVDQREEGNDAARKELQARDAENAAIQSQLTDLRLGLGLAEEALKAHDYSILTKNVRKRLEGAVDAFDKDISFATAWSDYQAKAAQVFRDWEDHINKSHVSWPGSPDVVNGMLRTENTLLALASRELTRLSDLIRPTFLRRAPDLPGAIPPGLGGRSKIKPMTEYLVEIKERARVHLSNVPATGGLPVKPAGVDTTGPDWTNQARDALKPPKLEPKTDTWTNEDTADLLSKFSKAEIATAISKVFNLNIRSIKEAAETNGVKFAEVLRLLGYEGRYQAPTSPAQLKRGQRGTAQHEAWLRGEGQNPTPVANASVALDPKARAAALAASHRKGA